MSSQLLLWKQLAQSHRSRPHINHCIGKYKSDEFRNLIEQWIGNLGYKKILKTDLREEAFGEDEILFSLSDRYSQIFALDISEETTKSAHLRQKTKGLLHKYITADVRELPFIDDTFDIILSSSTLDHFTTEDDLIKSLLELKRVIKPAGKMVITINNKWNFNFYLLLKLEKILRLNPYPVQFYSPKRFKRIIQGMGWRIQNEDFSVHVISPVNSILLLLRRFMKDDFVDKIAKGCISFAKWLGKRKTKIFTGWFIALHCVKS